LARILFIDNYDSFTHNLVQMFMRYDLVIDVFRCDKITLQQIDQKKPDYIVISPGPKDPAHAGISIDLVRRFSGEVPILGVCLGMQCINEAFGGRTVRAPVPVHGKTSRIFHGGQGIFNQIPSPFTATRYHSLMIIPDSTGLAITAESDDGVIMGISHPRHPVFGVQFHPESFMTDHGFVLIENFLKTGSMQHTLMCMAA
jgi:anthranilate synthase component II